MIHAASYSTEGMHCNQVVTRRHMPGEHRWRIKIRLETDSEIREELIEPDARIPIGALRQVVDRCLASVCATPDLIRRARMDFYVLKK